MKQILQNLRNGETVIAEVPAPKVRRGHVLIQTHRSLISSGTERMLVEFGRGGFQDKIRQQPEKVKMVLDKIRTDGIVPTLEAVFAKLDQPLPLGYANAGVVLEVGEGVTEFLPGDRVVSNGPHAEVVCVSKNLCTKIPPHVTDDEAAFTVIGAIALQGVRLAAPTLGECFVVTGLGLIGLITVGLLRAQGCKVIGLDLDPQKLEVAKQFGATTVNIGAGEDPLAHALALTQGHGVDGVILTLSSQSNEPIHQAATLCRKRGRIVLVGTTGLALNRNDFYQKELSFQVSCSYGPGRYDPTYEEEGQDYPLPYVRWTEARNFSAFLDLLQDKRIPVASLISHRFKIDAAKQAYDLILEDRASLAVLLTYDASQSTFDRILTLPHGNSRPKLNANPDRILNIAAIGSGNYATRSLFPAFRDHKDVCLKTVASARGVSATHAAKKFLFEKVTTEAQAIIDDADVHAVVISTRHSSHAHFVVESIKKRKHVFVEKPLAITHADVESIRLSVEESEKNGFAPVIMIGFNRRFSPFTQKMKELLSRCHDNPKHIMITVNALELPTDHWLKNPSEGGGRIVGEGCHFIDLARYLCGHPIVNATSTMLGARGGKANPDSASLSLEFADGSFASIQYVSVGERSFPKERIEVFCAGKILQLDNFKSLKGFGWSDFAKKKTWNQDKGARECVQEFLLALKGQKPSPIPFAEIIEVAKVAIDLQQNLTH